MKEKRTGEIVGSFVMAIVGLLFINSVLLWLRFTHGVILDTWGQILWAANLSAIAQVAGFAILAFYRPARLYSFVQLVFSGLGFVSIVVFYIIFPLDFAAVGVAWLNTLARVCLWIGMAGSLIGAVVWLVRFVAGRPYKTATPA